MPTALPRINVTITERQRAMLQELGAIQGRSAASYLREMLDASTPMLEALLVSVFRPAAEAEAKRPQALQEAIRAALEGVDAQKDQLSLLEHLAAAQGDISFDPGGGADATPSVAREDAGPAPRKRRKTA